MTLALRLLAMLKALPAWFWPIAALVSFSGVQTWRASHWKDQAQLCQAGRKQDRDRYVQAQKDAAAMALAAKVQQEAAYRAQAERTQSEYETELADASAAADRYIATHRVRAEGAQGASGGTGEGSDRGGAGSAIGPGETPELAVAVKADDVRICTENTTRLEAAREWSMQFVK